MGSQWTSKYAILRDLSFAQGRKVPAAIVGSVGVGQKPPAIKIKEDTEEEFFENCVGDGDVYTKPDLSLIKQMINMVHESDQAGGDNNDDDRDKVIEISKLNPMSEEFVPKVTGSGAENSATDKNHNEQADNNNDIEAKVNHVNTKREVKPTKKRKERNAAIISLLEKEQSSLAVTSTTDDSISYPKDQTSKQIPEVTNMHGPEVKLLKPNDFMIDTNMTEAVEKVNEWLQKPIEPQVEKAKSINISPKNMFKKKTPASLSLENTCMFKRKSDSSSIKSSDSDTVQRPYDNLFVPSTHANEYYKKYVEHSQVQEMAQEDIWKRAERLMKEIDAKRLKEKEKKIGELSDSNVELNVDLEENTNDGPRSSLPINIPGLESSAVRQSVLLPQHRHELPEECKVCLALAKYKRGQENTQ